MGWYLSFILVCVINGATLALSDLGPKDIRFWILVACQVGSYIIGRLNERGGF